MVTTHSIGVTAAVPHSKTAPMLTIPPLELAFHKGQEAKRLGRPLTDNPHEDSLTGLSAEWGRGYGT
jgi:hypothetical protein